MSLELRHLRSTMKLLKQLPGRDSLNYIDFYNSLTSNELQTIHNFTDDYCIINSELRDGTIQHHPIIDLFEKAPALENTLVVWRATNYPPPTGKVALKGFTFTSLNPLLTNSPVDADATILEITLMPGTRILLWNETNEQEVLLNHNIMANVIDESNNHEDALGRDHPELSVVI